MVTPGGQMACTSASSWRFHALFQQGFQLVGGVEVVFHRVLRGVRHQNNLFNPGGDDFVNDVLNHWLINDRQHLL